MIDVNVNSDERMVGAISQPAKETLEINYEPFNGCTMLLVNLGLFLGSIAFIIIPPVVSSQNTWVLALSLPIFIFSFILWFGFFTLDPNEAAVVILYGTYKGSVK